MSTITYTNQVPLQQGNASIPPRQQQRRYMNQRRRGGILGGNTPFYPYYPYYPYYRNNQYYPNNNRRNIVFYNRNYLPPQNFFYNRRYISRRLPPERRPIRRSVPRRSSRPRSRSNDQVRQRSRSRQRQQPQRQRGPRQLRLNDFMPEQFRDVPTDSPSLPQDFNIETTNVPSDALPQREIFASAATTTAQNNSTQPFVVNPTEQNQQRQQRTTTASHRRRQRRQRQQDNRRFSANSNRFAVLAEENENDNGDPIQIELIDTVRSRSKSKNKSKKEKKSKTSKKTRLYLEPSRILKWFEDSSKQSKNCISGRGNQAYTLASAPIYDKWVRNNYELQVWQEYLKLGTEQKHWAKEVVQRTKKRDDMTNIRFVKKKMKQCTDEIAALNATISDLQIQLSTYWMHTSSEPTTQKVVHATAELTANFVVDRIRQTTTTQQDTNSTAAAMASIKNQTRDPVDRLEKYILDYINKCTQNVKKMAQTRIQLAKAQMQEYKALEDFQQVATPTHWNTHLTLKSKIKIWSTKNKNHQLITKRIEYDLPPKCVSKIDFNFKIDEAIFNSQEAQLIYNRMREITRNSRLEAMTLYEQAAAREKELITHDIQQIIESLPQNTNEDEISYASFKTYCELREKRLNLEAEQSIHFLSEQRVEGDLNNLEEFVAPTLIRSLGEDFVLQP